jgi:hypothetical protein
MQHTSQKGSLKSYWNGKNGELSIAARNNGGCVFPPCATTCCKTEPAPADSPCIVTFVGSPPNSDIYFGSSGCDELKE